MGAEDVGKEACSHTGGKLAKSSQQPKAESKLPWGLLYRFHTALRTCAGTPHLGSLRSTHSMCRAESGAWLTVKGISTAQLGAPATAA